MSMTVMGSDIKRGENWHNPKVRVDKGRKIIMKHFHIKAGIRMKERFRDRHLPTMHIVEINGSFFAEHTEEPGVYYQIETNIEFIEANEQLFIPQP